MIDIQYNPSLAGAIHAATSDCGRVCYAPIGNSSIKIDGRTAYRGCYMSTDGSGLVTSERVAADVWAVAVALMSEVDVINNAVLDASRTESLNRAVERDDAEARLHDVVTRNGGEGWL